DARVTPTHSPRPARDRPKKANGKPAGTTAGIDPPLRTGIGAVTCRTPDTRTLRSRDIVRSVYRYVHQSGRLSTNGNLAAPCFTALGRGACANGYRPRGPLCTIATRSTERKPRRCPTTSTAPTASPLGPGRSRRPPPTRRTRRP